MRRRSSNWATSTLSTLVLGILVSAATVVSAEDDTIDERAVLLEFYQATGGDGWNENYGWAENLSDVCDWHGVVCTDEDTQNNGRRKRALQDPNEGFQQEFFQGQDTQQIENNVGETGGELSNLGQDSQYKVIGLNLPSNFLVGRTPDSLWSLPVLQELDLTLNKHLEVNFVGIELHENQLRSIKVRGTATTSAVGLSGLSETLQVLSLSDNELNSQIPAELYELTKLTSLHMAECGLLGSIPNDIHRLSLLHELNLFKNGLTGELPDGMSRLGHLRHLTLSFNQFHGEFPEYFNDYLLLEELWAVSNDFTGAIPALPNSPQLNKMFISGNSFSGEIPENFLEATIGGEPDINIHVDLSNNELGGIVPASLDSLQNVPLTIFLADNEWEGVEPILCDNVMWNEGTVAQFGCEGFLCPPGTFSSFGYRTFNELCQPCDSVEYFGSTSCFDKDDRSVLVELYVATKGETWDRNDNWLDDDDVCTWFGITCWDYGDERDGRIRRVELPNNGLVGTVPETIYSLEFMTVLDFSRNPVVVPFTTITEAENIFSVNIAGTQTIDFDGIYWAQQYFHELYADNLPIQGRIPPEIFGTKSLQVLSMQNCGLSGPIPEEILYLEGLQELYMSDNNLRGQLPEIWGNLENLEILALAKNQLTGTLPQSFDYAPSLLAVSLQDQTTKGGGIIGELYPYSSTKTLSTILLAKNKLEGEVPTNLLESIESENPVIIDVSNNLMTGKIPGDLSRFKKLNLYLEGNFITDMDEQLCHQDDWMDGSVRVFGCDAILCPPGTMGGRRMFTDSGCKLCPGVSAPFESGELYLGQQTCGDRNEELTERDILETLYDTCGGIGWHSSAGWRDEETPICDWYGIGCDENGSVSSIVLGNNQLVGNFPTEIFMLPNLVHLKLYSNTIYFSFEGIENVKGLKSLSLDNTGLESLRGVGSARGLTELNVGYNKLKGAIPEELSRLVNLETFVISNNAFDGFIPYWMRSLNSLTTFNAANNRLSGPLYDFAPFSDLVMLDLSYNQLTGEIPSTLFAGVDDEDKVVADLSGNKLEGTIPAELARLSNLNLHLKENLIREIDSDLCDATGGWNGFDVENFGCDGILCPAGTYNNKGRQTSADNPCFSCKKAKYMGTTKCGGSSASTKAVTLAIWVSTSVTAFFLFLL